MIYYFFITSLSVKCVLRLLGSRTKKINKNCLSLYREEEYQHQHNLNEN